MNKLLKAIDFFGGFLICNKNYGDFAQKPPSYIVHLSKKAPNDLTLSA
jgi:hypothetical protein